MASAGTEWLMATKARTVSQGSVAKVRRMSHGVAWLRAKHARTPSRWGLSIALHTLQGVRDTTTLPILEFLGLGRLQVSRRDQL